MRYDITVQTIVTRDDGRPFWRDEMQWFGVDDEVRDWLAGSCKTALFRMIGQPEVIDGPAYTVAYRTLVVRDGVVVSDTTLVEFPRLSYETVIDFQRFALDELREMQKMMVKKRTNSPASTRPRNRMAALLGLLRQVSRNRATAA